MTRKRFKVPDVAKYKEDKQVWEVAGSPTRSDEKVAELYEICAACDEFIPIPIVANRGQCSICTCLLSKDADTANKLRWATTNCPIGKWEAEIKIEAGQINDQPPKPQGGCGCS